jgi:hypothetical protein
MHAGLGLALAERIVTRLTPYSSAREFRSAAASFLSACDAHSQEGYAGAAYESLGLVARTWHPQLVAGIDAALHDLDPGIAGYFWHGAGRALYFLPTYIIPGLVSPWRGADREAPGELAHENLYAGLAWATTLVNIRHPQIMAHLLEVRGNALARSRGFANGVASAIVVGIDTTPDDPYVLSFAAYDGNGPKGAAAGLWDRIVRPAVRGALQRYHPLLLRARRLDAVFRDDDLEAIASRLERGETVPPVRSPVHPEREREAVGGGGERPGLYPASGAAAGSRGDRRQ